MIADWPTRNDWCVDPQITVNQPGSGTADAWHTWQDYWAMRKRSKDVCPHCGRCPVCGRKEEPKDLVNTITWGYVGETWLE